MTNLAETHTPIISQDMALKVQQNACISLRTLLGATCTYTASNIQDSRCRYAYAEIMGCCYALCSERKTGSDIFAMKQKLIELKLEMPKYFVKRWFSRENHYAILAVNHALEAIDSIIVRFVKGYSSENETFLRNVMEGDADGREICSHLERIGQVIL